MKTNNKEINYMVFVMIVGLSMMLTSFICSTIIFKGLLNTNNPIAIVLFIISLICFVAFPGVLIARFIFKRVELGKDVADIAVFVTSTVFYGVFGFFPSLMDSFSEQLQIEQLTEMAGVCWTIFGITAGLYILIIGWIAVVKKKKDNGLITNFCISLTPLFLNVVLNSTATLYLFIFGSKSLEWANSFIFTSLVFTCLGIVYYSIISVILGFRMISKNFNNN